MPLTALQKDVLAILAANESHFAGGIVLNAPDDSPRFSKDFDIFHEVAEEVARASERDVECLRQAGFEVGKISRAGEWTHESTFRTATIIRGTERVEINWAADSAFRFFPVEPDKLLGWRLHLFDVDRLPALVDIVRLVQFEVSPRCRGQCQRPSPPDCQRRQGRA